MMKNKLFKILLISGLILGPIFTSYSQIYVKTVPAAPVLIKSPQPSTEHIWVGDEWEPLDGSYKYAGGYWVSPPNKGYVWVPGHWKNNRRHGSFWVPGKWKRSN